MATVGFFAFIAGMLFNFFLFQQSILKKVMDDFCAFEHWYEKGIVSFTYNNKSYFSPENWSSIIVHEKLKN